MKLTIGILISNRIDTVKKCLDSVKPLIDKGIAELICVDTVSGTPGLTSDGSAELAKKYTDKVFVFPWINDFSAARNVTLEHAIGEWYMFCDDDEWFDDVSDIERFFSSNEYLKYNSASYMMRNYKDKNGSEWADTRAARCVKKTEDLRFQGIVHEHYTRIQLPCKELSSFTHHYGYAFENEEQKVKHRQRNIALLEKEMKNNPDELRLYAQMALELASFDNAKAMGYVKETLERFGKATDDPFYQWICSLKFPLYEALHVKAEEAEKDYISMKSRINLSETAQLAINYELTRLWLLENDTFKAQEYIDKYFRLLSVLMANDDMRQRQNTADFAKYLAEDKIKEMEGYKNYMDNNGIKIEDGVISYGKKIIELTGTVDEMIRQLDEMPFEDFQTAVDEVIEKSPACFDDELLNHAIDYFSVKNPIEYCFLLYRMSEEEIKRAVERGVGGEAIFELFNECICTERRMYEMLYKPEVFTEKGIRWMSPRVRYNDILFRFINGSNRDIKVTLEAAKICPDMAKVIKVWLGALK